MVGASGRLYLSSRADDGNTALALLVYPSKAPIIVISDAAAATYAAPAPVLVHAYTQTDIFTAPALVIEYVTLAPFVEHRAPDPAVRAAPELVVEHVMTHMEQLLEPPAPLISVH